MCRCRIEFLEVKSGGGCCLKVGSWESCCCVGRRSSGCFLDVMRCALLNTCRNNTIVVVVVVVVVVICIVVFIICSVVVVYIVVRCNTVFIFSIVQYSVWMFVVAECFWEGWWHFGVL